MSRLATALCIASLFVVSSARATTDMPGPFDARSVGLGGTGAAWLGNPTAIYANPARLDAIDKLSVTLDFSPFMPKTKAPLPLPGAGSYDSASAVNPLFFAGAAYRVLDGVVLGLAAYPTAGVGSRFDTPSGPLESAIFVLEAQPSASVRLLDNLSFGVGWRVSYANQSSSLMQPGPGGQPLKVEQTLSGVSLLGLQAGLAWAPLPILQLGLSYRSKTTVGLEGTTTVEGAGEADSSADFSTPHALRAGAALHLLEDRLMIALDVKLHFYKDSNKSMVVTTESPMGSQKTTVPMAWKNTVSGHLGLEYKVLPALALRLGYSMMQSATPEETASAFAMPPGLIHTPSVGVGYRLNSIDVDLGAFYSFVSSDVAANPVNGVAAGTYETNSLIVALTGTYHY